MKHITDSKYYKEQYEDLAGNIIYEEIIEDNRTNQRSFILGGIGFSYRCANNIELYGNISQNYRAINFNDMRVANPSLRVDPDLKDESGYGSDIGIRGDLHHFFNYDLSLFYMQYNERIGSVMMVDSVLFNTYRYRTNISDSRNYGIETFVEADLWKVFLKNKAKGSFSLFVNTAFIDARYVNSEEEAYENKKVELVPSILIKTGLTFKIKNFKSTFQYAYTGEQFTDATNAEYTSEAVNGIIPAYSVMDISLEYIYKRFTFSGSINNVANQMYFTRRADGYPGPGIIPSDGRGFYVTIQIKL
jgi:Fe(3+) dicitrate transport protein